MSDMTYEDYAAEREADTILAVKAAMEARKQAVTFKTSVGAAVITKDGGIWSGFNIEAYGYKFELHAEEMCVVRAMGEGYRGTDFECLVVVFQSGWSDKIEVYPGCPYCWAFLNEFTHSGLKMVIADIHGQVLYKTTLREMFTLPLDMIYPSAEYKKAKPKLGTSPKL